VLIQHQVIIAKMSTADSQWKFLVLNVKSEDVCA
jgi:hypothetical protein